MATTEGRYNTTVLASEISKAFGMPKAQALRVVSATFTAMGNALARGEVVSVHSFGNFKPLKTKERKGRNPRTGEETVIAASIRPHFVAAQNLKNKVKDQKEEALETAPAPAPAAAPKAPKAPKAPTAKQPAAKAPVAGAQKQPVTKAPVAGKPADGAAKAPDVDEL